MNDPNKNIDVNLSCLLSLKAELLRKQAEVSKVKATRSTAQIIPSKAKTYKTDTITGLPARTKKDSQVYEVEDSALLEKSKKVLEAKSKYYDRMTAMSSQLNSDYNLVLFNRKKQEKQFKFPAERRYSSTSADSFTFDEENRIGPSHPDNGWVEYTDCLGRTRKCMRGDLELIKKKDNDLATSIPERLDQTQPNRIIDMVDKKSSDELHTRASVVSVMSKYYEMRNNWEKKEIENITKENVHYQDVFFDEARQHGVGYYAFSTDDEERVRQQKELEEARQKTLNEQANREAKRNNREKIIAERVMAAKNRHRARLGLPQLEEAKEENNEKKLQKETKLERKKRKREEKLKRRQQMEEQIREEERQNYIRPWDKKKPGVYDASDRSKEPQIEESWIYRPDRNPMSQEEWNNRKRTERNLEFAPSAEEPFQKDLKRKGKTFDYESTIPLHNKISRTIFKADDSVFSITLAQNPFASVSVNTGGCDSFAPFQSTKGFQKKNCSAFKSYACEETSGTRRGVEMPPPPDMGMEPERSIRPQQTQQSLESSIEDRLKFLRNNFDNTV